ncbi:MAG: hypothetical protein ACHRXM_04445 [Isosphaerales bacterium]
MIGELALLALLVLVLYGRSGVLKSRRFQSIWPWISPQRRTAGQSGRLRAPAPTRPRSTTAPASPTPGIRGRAKPFLLQGNRLFWFLTILAATAVAALVITRVMIASGAGPGVTR